MTYQNITVKDFISMLYNYNLNSTLKVLVHSQECMFELSKYSLNDNGEDGHHDTVLMDIYTPITPSDYFVRFSKNMHDD